MISHSELTKLLIDLEHTTPKLLPAFIGKVIQATSAGVVREGGLLPENIRAETPASEVFHGFTPPPMQAVNNNRQEK